MTIAGAAILVRYQQDQSHRLQLRGINHIKLVDRVSDLEEKVFGESRG